MQRRPLRQALVKGDLPRVFGHCLSGQAKPRFTITSAKAQDGEVVWNVGGMVAEKGAHASMEDHARTCREALKEGAPWIDTSSALVTSQLVQRAEGSTDRGARPDTPTVRVSGNVIVGWPTKLVLAPRLAADVCSIVEEAGGPAAGSTKIPENWPRPQIATPPWEEERTWI